MERNLAEELKTLEELNQIVGTIDSLAQFGASMSTIICNWARKHNMDPVALTGDILDSVKFAESRRGQSQKEKIEQIVEALANLLECRNDEDDEVE